LGIKKQNPFDERERSWGGREGVIQMSMVLFGDSEISHAD